MNNKNPSEILKALAHPTRLQIIAGLMNNECNVGQIQKKLGVPQSTISQHLRVLRSSGIIKARHEGAKRCYKVVDNRVRKITRIIIREE